MALPLPYSYCRNLHTFQKQLTDYAISTIFKGVIVIYIFCSWLSPVLISVKKTRILSCSLILCFVERCSSWTCLVWTRFMETSWEKCRRKCRVSYTSTCSSVTGYVCIAYFSLLHTCRPAPCHLDPTYSSIIDVHCKNITRRQKSLSMSLTTWTENY